MKQKFNPEEWLENNNNGKEEKGIRKMEDTIGKESLGIGKEEREKREKKKHTSDCFLKDGGYSLNA